MTKDRDTKRDWVVFALEFTRAMATSEAFALWLMHQPAGSGVGYRSVPRDCPLARFLRYMLDVPYAAATPDSLFASLNETGDTGVRLPTPKWARRFIRLVDADWGPHCGPRGLVTPEEALTVLGGGDLRLRLLALWRGVTGFLAGV